MRGKARAFLQNPSVRAVCPASARIPLGSVRELLGAAAAILAICPSRYPDIVGTADARPRIAGAAVRSLSCGSA